MGRHTAHTIVSWPNPKQWVIVHTSDLMMIIRQSIYILSIITREMGKLKTHSLTYCIMDNWENMPYLTKWCITQHLREIGKSDWNNLPVSQNATSNIFFNVWYRLGISVSDPQFSGITWYHFYARITTPKGGYIHAFNSSWPRDTIYVSKLCHHWFRLWLVAWSAPSHNLNQWWHIVNWTLGNKFQWIKMKQFS